MDRKIFWSPEEHARVLQGAAKKIRDGSAYINLEQQRVFGMKKLLEQVQTEVIDRERQRPMVGGIVLAFVKQLREELKKLPQSPLPSLPVEEPPEEPVIPSRLGLNPKFSEAIAFVAQEITRAFAESLGEAIGKHVRDAIYDVRHHLGASPGYVGREASPMPPASREEFGNLPEKFHHPKVCVLGLLPVQQQTIQRSFPNLRFRFLGKGTSSDHVRQVAMQCERTFSMVKFIRHSDERLVPSDRLRRVSGGMTDLTRAIMQAFPATLYASHSHPEKVTV